MDSIPKTPKIPSWKEFQTLILSQDHHNPVWDPISLPRLFTNPQDQEIVALLSSLYSYGNVRSILNFLKHFLSILKPSPKEFFVQFQDPTYRKKFKSQWKGKIGPYRFQKESDHFWILERLSDLWEKKQGSFEPLFVCDRTKPYPILGGMQSFIKSVSETSTSIPYHSKRNSKLSYGSLFLIGKPNPWSAHKRLLMFLRWMVRSEAPDFGIYKTWKPTDLLFPLDVHIARISKILGISQRKTIDAKLAIEITDYFREIAPNDPVSYDYTLSRMGIVYGCRGKLIEKVCRGCYWRLGCKEGSKLVVPRGIEPRLQG